MASEVEVVVRGPVRLLWQAGPPPALSDDQQQAVEETWARGKGRMGDALYNAPVLVYRGHETAGGLTTIRGVYHPYRYYYAQCNCAGLDCGIEPMGVSGVTVLSEGGVRYLTIGRRGANVAQYAGQWECVPSGGMDHTFARPDGTVDFAAMLLHEFEEEVCLPSDRVGSVAPFAVIYDPLARTRDICCVMHVAATCAELRQATRRSQEYTEVLFVAEKGLDETLRCLGDGLIPLSRAMLELYRETDDFQACIHA